MWGGERGASEQRELKKISKHYARNESVAGAHSPSYSVHQIYAFSPFNKSNTHEVPATMMKGVMTA